MDRVGIVLDNDHEPARLVDEFRFRSLGFTMSRRLDDEFRFGPRGLTMSRRRLDDEFRFRRLGRPLAAWR